MEQDILPDLLATIEQQFDQRTYDSAKLKKALQALKDKRATYIDVNEFAIEIGEILAKVFKMNISAEILPDGKMYFNIADRLLNATLSKNHELISNYAIDVQTEMNHAAGYRIKGQAPGINQNKVDGLVNKISDTDDFSKVEWLLGEPIINFSQSIVDEIIKSNVDFHAKVGMQPRLRRRADGHKPCKWCKSLAGTYDYPDVPDDVYRRHERCRCTVEYNPKDGRGIQDSHSKVWTDPSKDDKIKMRKTTGINPDESLAKREYSIVNKEIKEQLQAESDRWYGTLSDKGEESVKKYTGPWFDSMNGLLRDKNHPTLRNPEVIYEAVDEFSNALSQFKLEHDIVTYRGISKNEYDSIVKNTVFKDFKSTSTRKFVAETFQEYSDDNYLVTFKIPKGTSGAFVGTHSSVGQEDEFTLNKGSKYRAIKTEKGLEVIIIGKEEEQTS